MLFILDEYGMGLLEETCPWQAMFPHAKVRTGSEAAWLVDLTLCLEVHGYLKPHVSVLVLTYLEDVRPLRGLINLGLSVPMNLPVYSISSKTPLGVAPQF